MCAFLCIALTVLAKNSLWNYYLPPQVTKPSPKSHKKFDHNQIWTQLPHLVIPKLANPARTSPPDFSQRIDTVFFKRHVDDWNVRIKTQIPGDLVENPTGQALADLIHKELEILAKEIRWLQDKAWKARRRAGERKEHRNKTQNTLRQRISLLQAALRQQRYNPRIRLKELHGKPCKAWDFSTSDLPSRNWLDNTTDGRPFSQMK